MARRISDRIKEWHDRQVILILTLYLSYRDPRVSLFARIFTFCIVAYALSPIDLIPDFIPIIGHLDDLIIVPLGIYIAFRLIPREVIAEKRERAEDLLAQEPPRFRSAAVAVLLIWTAVLACVLTKIVYH